MPRRFKLSVFMSLIICLLICIILFVIYHQVLFQADPVPDSTIMASSVIAISDTSSVKYASHVVPETKNIEIKSTNNTATENDSRIIDIRDVINARNGDTIYLPAGIYFISRALRLKSNTLLMGQGMEETKIIAQKDFHDSPAMIIFEREASNITIKDVCLDGNNDAFDTVSAIFGIRTYISDEYIYTNNSNVTIEGVEIKNTSQHGISLEGKTKNWAIINCYIHDIGNTQHAAGIYVSGTNGFILKESRIDSCYEHGLYFSSGGDVLVSDSYFRYNGQSPGGQGISMRADSNIVISGCKFLYNTGLGLVIYSNRTDFVGRPVRNIVVSGNTIAYNYGGVKGSGRQDQVLIAKVKSGLFIDNVVGPGIGSEALQNGIRIIYENKDLTIRENFIYAKTGIAVSSFKHVGDTANIFNLKIENNIIGPFSDGTLTYGIRLGAIKGENLIITGTRGKGMRAGILVDPGYSLTNTVVENNHWKDNTHDILNMSHTLINVRSDN